MAQYTFYVLILFVGVTISEGGVVKSTNDLLDDVEPVVDFNHKLDYPLPNLPVDNVNERVTVTRDVATTQKSSMWLTGQHGGRFKSGLEPNIHNADSSPEIEDVNLNKPQFNYNGKSSQYDFGYGYMAENQVDDFKWGDLNLDEIISDLENTNLDVFSNGFRLKRDISKNSRQYVKTSTMNSQDRNDGTTMKLDSGVQTKNHESGKLSDNEIPKELFTSNPTNTTSASMIPLKNNQSDTTTAASEKYSKIPLTNNQSTTTEASEKNKVVALENTSFIKTAHHFFQRLMFWKSYKTQSMSF